MAIYRFRPREDAQQSGAYPCADTVTRRCLPEALRLGCSTRRLINNNVRSNAKTRMETMSSQEQMPIRRSGQCGRTLSQRFKTSMFLLTILGLLTSPAFAQLTTADILGTVTDISGAVVPNASITLINLGTNEQRTSPSNSSGDYSFTLLPVGH